MIVYIIKSSLCLVVLLGFYAVFLEKEKIHMLKRYYLIFSVVFAFSIPLVTFTYEKEVTLVPIEEVSAPMDISTDYIVDIPQESIQQEPKNDNSIVFWRIYGIGVLIFGFRFLRNIYTIGRKVRTNEKLKGADHTTVLLWDDVIPHTFLKYVFVSKSEFFKNVIPDEVLSHEIAHVKQRHTLDILFVELMQIIFWFNPLLFWTKKLIRLNHEFLADQTVLKQEFSVQKYVNLLLSYPNSPNQTELTSTLNYSLTKKRLLMMTSEFSKRRVTLKLIATLPVIALCMLLFNQEIIAQEKNVFVEAQNQTSPKKEIKIKIKGESITINGKQTDLKDFANAIDDYSKAFKDDELVGFNFDVVLQNVENDFIAKVNTAYKKTRLYRANPNRIDLVPPPPPAPILQKEGNTALSPSGKDKEVIEEIIITPPAPPAPPAVGGNQKPPKAPKPPKTKKQPSLKTTYTEIYLSEDEDWTEEEMQELQKRVEIEIEKKRKERKANQGQVNISIRKSEKNKEKAIRLAEKARRKVETDRRLAMLHAQEARAHAQEKHRSVLRDAQEARREAMHHAEEARRNAEQVRREAEAAAREVAIEAEEIRRSALQQAREASRNAREQSMKQRVAIQKVKEDALLRAEEARAKAVVAREEALLAAKFRNARHQESIQEEMKRIEGQYNSSNAKEQKKMEKIQKEYQEALDKIEKVKQKALKKTQKILEDN